MSITIEKGSILDFEGDAIVNPANSFLRHAGGLARIIANAATDMRNSGVIPVASPNAADHAIDRHNEAMDVSQAWQAEQEDHLLIATGNAGITSAGHLPYKSIIHAVGPIWNGGDFQEATLLYSAHREAFQRAVERDYESIAFPAISCGIFGYPVDQAAYVAISAIRWEQKLRRIAAKPDIRVTFALFEDAHLDHYQQALSEAVTS